MLRGMLMRGNRCDCEGILFLLVTSIMLWGISFDEYRGSYSGTLIAMASAPSETDFLIEPYDD